MKKSMYILIVVVAMGIASVFIHSCAPVAAISAKSGVQLWGENCQRCHNTPPPSVFNDDQWETVGIHMKLRANLTEDEVHKVIAFLGSAN